VALRLANGSAGAVRFRLSIDGLDPFDRASLARGVREKARASGDVSERAVASEAWSVVRSLSNHDHPVLPGPWAHGPDRYLASAGRGFCDDAATVLAQLWTDLGLKARIWRLDCHVVPEVFVDGRWEMHDPDLDVRYRSADDRVLGVEELRDCQTPVRSPSSPRLDGTSLHSLANRYGNHIAEAYRTASQHVDVEAMPGDREVGWFVLPRGATLTIGVRGTPRAEGERAPTIAVLTGVSEGCEVPLVPWGHGATVGDGACFLANPHLFSPRRRIEVTGADVPPALAWEQIEPERRLTRSPAFVPYELRDLPARLRAFDVARGSQSVDLHDPVDRRAAARAASDDPTVVRLLDQIEARLTAAEVNDESTLMTPVPFVSIVLMAEAGRGHEVLAAAESALGLNA
jgi:hypothetical protein